jgi:hypothetical protein
MVIPQRAQAADSDRSASLQTVSQVTTVAGVATAVLMPRIFYADPETTVGWKARWHASVLAPTFAQLTLTMLNEFVLKDEIRAPRPGCTELGGAHCQDYESLSSHTFVAFAALGQGTTTFLVDTLKWNDGRVNVGALVGHVGVPVLWAGATALSRGAGNWETSGTLFLSSLAGIGVGALTGLAYAVLQRPDCGYEGGIICW